MRTRHVPLSMSRGVLYALGAFVSWGLFPLYWKSLGHVPTFEVLCHRVVWSFVALALAIFFMRQWQAFRENALRLKNLGVYAAASMLIGMNWLLFVWAVNSGFVVDTSLGYYINPLFSVLLGVIFFRERLRLWQWIAIACAGGGVLQLSIAYGKPPWISFALAASFGIYGLMKKKAPLSSLHGLSLETAILFLPAAVFLLVANVGAGEGATRTADLSTLGLLVAAGFVTTLPLFLFTKAAQEIPLSLLGMFQYISPTLQLLLGVSVFHEPFSPSQWAGFGTVWLGLLAFMVEGVLFRARERGRQRMRANPLVRAPDS